jgi:hypothetical protein
LFCLCYQDQLLSADAAATNYNPHDQYCPATSAADFSNADLYADFYASLCPPNPPGKHFCAPNFAKKSEQTLTQNVFPRTKQFDFSTKKLLTAGEPLLDFFNFDRHFDFQH